MGTIQTITEWWKIETPQGRSLPCGCTECGGELTALEFLMWRKANRCLPLSTEFPNRKASRSEVRRWLEKKSVVMNSEKPGPKDKAPLPIKKLVFFPKGKRKTTML